MDLEDLPGVGPATADKIKKAGYDIQKIAASSPHELSEVAGMGVETAKKIISAARDSLEMGFEKASEIMDKRKDITKITTKSKNLNELLGGGIETMAITEFYGRYGSGKSQVCYQLAVNTQLPIEDGGMESAVLWVDTESSFRPERVAQMAEALGLNSKEVLDNIFVAKAINSDHQIILIEKADELIREKNIKLIVVDSLTAHFRVDYAGRGALGERQQKLNKHIHILQKLADKYNLAIVIANQVMDNPGILFGDPTTPIGGNVLGHAATYRIYLRKSREEKRVARLVDSPCLPDNETIFKVKPEGIRD